MLICIHFEFGGYEVTKRIVVLGAGYAGLLVAKKLEKKFTRSEKKHVEITIIDKNPFFTMLTELHEVAAWRVDESSIRIDLEKVFAGRDVNVVKDNIIETDYQKNILTGELGTYQYDYLVVATGCKPTFFGVDGAEEHAFTLWSYDDAVRLREHIMNMFKLAYQEKNHEKIKELLTFYVVGGGFTGVEMAGELAELVPFVCAKYHIDPKLVTIVNVDVLDRLVTIMPEKLSDKTARRLEKMGVTVSMKTNVVRISENEIEVEKDGQRLTEKTHTVIWAAGTEGSDIAQKSEALGLVERTRGRIQTDQYLRSKQYQNVYVAGDNIFYIPEGEERAVPQMVENCEACAPVIAENIVSEVTGSEPKREYKPKFHGAMVCIGGRYGVAHVGTPEKRVSLPSFIAMLAKHFMNIVLFSHILGWNKIYSYITHEFFTIRNRRSFLGGHFSNRSATFFVVPLRVFMGIFMFYKGYVNMQLGWIDSLKLRDVFYGVAGQFRPVAPYMPDINILDRIHFSIVVAGGEMTMWLQTSAANWFLQSVVFASEASEMFVQRLMIVFLMLLGLAFMAGLFTTLASFGALAVAVIMILTVGLPFSMWWMPFAAIALLFTGGRVLSLDYYVMPWLGKWWKNKAFVQRLYVYND